MSVSPDDELLRAVTASAPAGVLRLLAGVAQASGAADELPVVVVHLSGGQTLEGAVVTVGADRGCEAAVLADRRTGRLGYVLLGSVIAVEVCNPGPVQDLLTTGRLPPPGERVTRLALQREFAPSAEFPVQIDWDALSGSERILGNAARLLAALREAVSRACGDEFGRQAWAARARFVRVDHRADTSLTVERDGDGLHVYADLTAALPRALADTLHQRIDSLL